MNIKPYLIFKGNCQEAIDLYTKAFEAKVIELARASDIPQNHSEPIQIPDYQKNWILQATMQFGDNYIRLSDCFSELNDPQSERLSLAVECSIDEVKHAFSILEKEGEVGVPLHETFFSPCHGVIIDKFGVMWTFIALS